MKRVILLTILMGLLPAEGFAQRGSHVSAPSVRTIGPDRTITPNASGHVNPNAVTNARTKTVEPNARPAAGAKTVAPTARTAPEANTVAPDAGVSKPDAQQN